jgi:hypothetical protein
MFLCFGMFDIRPKYCIYNSFIFFKALHSYTSSGPSLSGDNVATISRICFSAILLLSSAKIKKKKCGVQAASNGMLDAWDFVKFDLTVTRIEIKDIQMIHRPIDTLPRNKTNSVGLVREQTIPTERPPLVGKLVPTFADKGIPTTVLSVL